MQDGRPHMAIRHRRGRSALNCQTHVVECFELFTCLKVLVMLKGKFKIDKLYNLAVSLFTLVIIKDEYLKIYSKDIK